MAARLPLALLAFALVLAVTASPVPELALVLVGATFLGRVHLEQLGNRLTLIPPK